MELSPNQELQLQGSDLAELAGHNGFVKDIHRAKQRLNERLLPIARKYWITDLDWLRYVIKTWDGCVPLPAPNDPVISRSNDSRYDLATLRDGVFTMQTGSYDGSPRMLWRRSLIIDQLGSKWLVLRIRLFPGLRPSSLSRLIKESLEFAWHHPAKNKKATKAVIAQQFLNTLSEPERIQSNYRLAMQLRGKLGISMESAKNYVRAWRRSEASKTSRLA